MTAVSLRCESGCGGGPPIAPPVVVGLVLTAVLAVGAYAAVRVRKLGPAIMRSEISHLVPACVVLVTTFATGAGSLAFPLLGAGYEPSDALLTVMLGAAFAALLLFSRSVSLSLRDVPVHKLR